MRNEEVFEYHRSILSLFFSFLFVVLPVSFFYVLVSTSVSRNSLLPLAQMTLLYRLFCIAVALEMMRRFFNELYVFGHNRIIHFNGRISLRLSRIAIAYKDIRDVGVRQGILGRIFDFGTVTFATSSKDDIEITMLDIPHPRKIAAFVQQHMEELNKENPNLRLPENTIPSPLPEVPEQESFLFYTTES